MCSLLPLVFALMQLYNPFIVSVHLKKKSSGIDKSDGMVGDTSKSAFIYFFNKGNMAEANSSNFLCLMFVCVCFALYLCMDW